VHQVVRNLVAVGRPRPEVALGREHQS
jgi:hypothetical protein